MKTSFSKSVFLFLSLSASLISPVAEAQISNAGKAIIAGGILGAALLKGKKNNQKTNQPNNNSNNVAKGKDTAAVLNFNTKSADQFAASGVQDISGVWEGEQSNGGLIMYYKLALYRLSNDTYSGYDYCLWQKTIDRTPVKTGADGMAPNGKKSFLSTFKNAEVNVTEIAQLDNSKWGLTTEKFKVVDDNGSPAIINDNNQPQRKFYLTRTSTVFPQDDLAKIINSNTVQIVDPVFKNSAKEPVLKYSDHGQLTLSVKNTSAIDFNDVKGQLTTEESNNGILDYDKLYGTFNIPKNSETALPLNINTSFDVPSGKEHFNIVFSYNDMVIAKKTIEVSTRSFYKTDVVTVPSYMSSRLQGAGNYFGYANIPYGDASKLIDPLVASDKLATMWKSAFLYMGRGEYKHDETEAYALAKSSLPVVEEKARGGDAEALYLLWYACQMGLEGEVALTQGDVFLQKASDAGFIPAMYEEALRHYQQKDYSAAYEQFQKLNEKGVKKADNMTGILYEQGYGVNKDDNAAIEWYKKGMAFGDPDAMQSLANIYAAGYEDAQPDITKAISFATMATARRCTEAMVFLGRKYADGGQGVSKNMTTAMKWLSQAADLGDRKAMLAMGAVYLSDEPGVVKDERKGFFWIKKAAESGSPNAMKFLSQCYRNGTYTEKDEVAARYWYNQAVVGGYAQADATGVNAAAQTFSDFWNNADFSPSYVYVDEYNNVVGDSGDGFLGGIFGGVMGAARNYYSNQQQLIDGLEYVCKKNGYKIYGGTVSSSLVSNLYLKQGQTVNIKAYGVISTGMMSGLANADGLGNNWQEYAYIKGIPCSAVMAEVKDGSWQFIGQKNSLTAAKDGALVFAVNGIDYRNYKGYFDLVVQVPDGGN